MSAASAPALEPVEVASGLVLGLDPAAARRGEATSGETPRAVLERAVLPALERSPCLVSFSGGRDSSAVLAVAAHVARREGLPLPIPATNRFPGAASTDESEWQERVVSHLGLEDWLRVELGDELGCVGPVAAEALRRHGLLWPFNAHFHVPLLEGAAGGTLLTGIGGDELLTEPSWSRASDVLALRARPAPRDALRVGFVLAPQAVRRAALSRKLVTPFPWLRPDARRAVAGAWAAQAAAEPLRWSRRFRWIARLRSLRVGTASLRLLAEDAGVGIEHPFLTPGFGAALAALPARGRPRHRTDAMRSLFGDLLPDEVLTRETKTVFDEAFWSDASRAFAASWNGTGVDESVVDVEALQREWASPEPDPRSFLLAQAAWLAREERYASVSSRQSVAAASESQALGRRSSQAGSAARSSSAAGSRGGSITPR